MGPGAVVRTHVRGGHGNVPRYAPPDALTPGWSHGMIPTTFVCLFYSMRWLNREETGAAPYHGIPRPQRKLTRQARIG
jgi:hypothetical protein